MEKLKELFKKVKKIKINKEKTIQNIIMIFVFLLLYILMVFLDGIELHNFQLEDIFEFKKILLNYFIIVSIFYIFDAIIGRRKAAVISIVVISICFGFINYVVTQVRGIAITISDIYSIGTAISVAKGIKLDVNINFFIAIVILLIIGILIHFIKKREKLDKIKRIACAITGVIILIVITHLPYVNDIAIWDINKTYKEHGSGLTILRMVKDLNIKKPEDYSKKEIENYLREFEDDEIQNEQDVNVIVIMNESFADLPKVYDMQLKEDNIPFFHSLENEIKIGEMHSSKYGGGTANVEYEFLTQNTTAFLPVGSMPYQQYINKKTKSIVSYMNDLNYKTIGIHSWYKNGYSRGKVYKYLEFNKSIFKEDMPDLANEFTEYSSDKSTYDELIKQLENKNNNEKIFSFVLTMQNHLPYNHIDENGKIYIEDDEELNCYFQIEHKSDVALEELINYLKGYNEKTIVLFFGDHQPNWSQSENYKIKEKYSEEEARYIVPYFIWTNYKTDLLYPDNISTNYLQSILIENAGIYKDAYTKYIEKLREDIPIITTQYYIDKEGNRYDIDDNSSPYYDKLKEYEKIIYYNMFDK